MTTVNLNKLELNEFTGKSEKTQHCRATFPLIGVHGSKELAAVYFELEPGDHLGRHTDSAEELLIVLEGDVLVEVNGEHSMVSSSSFALVPKMAPHNLVNAGATRARILGVFGGANNIVATFEKEWLPTNSNMIDTAQMT